MNIKAISHLIVLAVGFMGSGVVLAAPPIVLRTAVTPQEAWVGQQVILHIDVLARDGWAQLKKVRDAEINGAYLLRLESQGTRLSEMIEGARYTGQRYEFMLFPQREGTLSVAPIPVDVEVKVPGTDAGAQIRRMSTPSIKVVAKTPAGAAGIRGLISTSNLTAKQQWNPEIASARVGDAIKRTVILRAEGVSGMAFTPVPHGEIENLGIYPGEPTVQDTFDRGDLVGTRTETMTYVFERPGHFEVPAIVVPWWDIRKEELKRIELPGLSLQVNGAIDTGPRDVEQSRQQNTRLLWSVLLAVLVAAAITLRFGHRMANRCIAWRNARRKTEAAYFKRILQSARSGDRDALLRDTMRWLDRINADPRPARLDRFMQQFGDAGMQKAAFDLTRGLFHEGDRSDITALIGALTVARKRWRQALRQTQHSTGTLPELNGGR